MRSVTPFGHVPHLRAPTPAVHSRRRRDPDSRFDPRQPAAAAGNLAMMRALGIRAKLDVSHPSDLEEQEAERMADAFASTEAARSEIGLHAEGNRIHRSCAGCEADDESIHRKPLPSGGASPRPLGLPGLAASPGQTLPRGLRRDYERFFDADLSHVRVHAGGPAAAAARSLHAQAFALGRDIYFGGGRYAPDTQDGRKLLAHELAHIVQHGTDTVEKVDRQSINNPRYPCHETAVMPGGMGFFGTLVHLAIQQHYVRDIDPSAATEYVIPGSSATGATGRADIVDSTGGIYEIKPLGLVGQAFTEAEGYVLHAEASCDPNVNWHLGMWYFPLSMAISGSLIISWLYGPGIIAYTRSAIPPVPERVPKTETGEKKAPQPKSGPDLAPAPVLRPTPVTAPSTYQLILQWAKHVAASGADAARAAHEFLTKHPGLAWAILALGVVGIVALAADDVTLVGIADDVLIPIIAVLMRVAWRFAF